MDDGGSPAVVAWCRSLLAGSARDLQLRTEVSKKLATGFVCRLVADGCSTQAITRRVDHNGGLGQALTTVWLRSWPSPCASFLFQPQRPKCESAGKEKKRCTSCCVVCIYRCPPIPLGRRQTMDAANPFTLFLWRCIPFPKEQKRRAPNESWSVGSFSF